MEQKHGVYAIRATVAAAFALSILVGLSVVTGRPDEVLHLANGPLGVW